MSEELALKIPLQGDVSPISQALDSMKSKVSDAMGNVRDAMGAVGLMAAGYLKSSIESAAKGEENFANLTQTIKSTGAAAGFSAEQIKAMSKELSSQTTFSAGEIMKGQNMLLTFTNIQGDVLKKASMAMLDLSQKYGTAPEQQAIALGKALNDPIKGITALTRVGVTFTDQQKEQIQAMEEAGNMAGAQNIILKELNTEFGGQASAAVNTYNGQLKQMTNSFNSIKSAIGSVLLPYFKEIAERLNTAAQSFAKFAGEHKQLIAGVLSVTAVLGTLIGGAGLLQKVFTVLGPVVSGIGGLIGGLSLPIVAVIGAIALLTTAYVKNFGGLKTAVDSAIGPIISGLKNLFDAFITGKSISGAFWKSFKDVLGENVAGKISNAIGAVEYSIKGLFKFLKGDLSGAKNMFYNIFGEDDKKYEASAQKIVDALSSVKAFLINIVNVVKNNIPQIKATISAVFGEVVKIFVNIVIPAIKIVIQFMGTLISWVIANWPKIKAVIEAVFNAIKFAWENILKPVLKFIIEVLSGVVKWVSDNWPLIHKTIKTILDGIWSVIQTILNNIKSFWNTWGQTIMDYVSTVFNNIKIVISTVIKVIEDIIKAIMQAINGDWKGAWNSLVQAVSDIFGGIGKVISNIIDGIGKIFGDLAKIAIKWGENMINGFIDGIKSKINAAKDAVSGVIHGVKDFLGFNSPSKEGEGRHIVEWGSNMIKGFQDGIKAQIPSMNNLLRTAIPNLSTQLSVKGNIAPISTMKPVKEIAKPSPTYLIMDKKVVGKILSEPISQNMYANNSSIALGIGGRI